MADDKKVDIIAIDGPAGSGKSTTARLVAKKLGFIFLDTGAMYRAFTLKALQNKVDLKNESELVSLIDNTEIKLFEHISRMHIYLDGVDVTKKIRSEDVSISVSTIASQPAIRKWMVQLQRQLGRQGKVVAEGRDIGTVVFPNARLKIFLVASIEVRAKRRLKDFSNNGEEIEIGKVIKAIENRDKADSRREVSPLQKADDAIEVDTTNLTIEQQVETIIKYWHQKNVRLSEQS